MIGTPVASYFAVRFAALIATIRAWTALLTRVASASFKRALMLAPHGRETLRTDRGDTKAAVLGRDIRLPPRLAP